MTKQVSVAPRRATKKVAVTGSKYQDLLQESQSEKDAAEVKYQVEEGKLGLQSDILATKK